MSRNERANRILELVAKSGHLDVEAAAKQLKVSLATVRRDFDELASRQLVTRTHGGIQAVASAYDLPLRYKTAKDSKQKQRIAKAAAALVQRGDRIGLNGGTTTTEIGRELIGAQRLISGDGDVGLTVVTNAVNIATEMVVRPYIKIVVTGGVARPQSFELIGESAAHALDGLVLDIAFIGVNALDIEHGATANHEGEAKVGGLIAKAAKRVVVVSASEKLGNAAFARICKISEVDTLITDNKLTAALKKQFEDQGVEVIVC